jgi:hypothetical protein
MLPQLQPACITDPATGLTDCGNWAVSAAWTVPANATSGVYLAKLVREDPDDGRASHIAFIVRDDDGGSDVLLQTSDTTWQAYNTYGGNSLYAGGSTTPPMPRAHKVSYNRPFVTRGGPSEDWVFNAEFPMIRWLEANGFDVSYSTDVDTDRRGAELLEHRVYLSVGHDEYWSAGQRAAVEAARAAGVHLAFFSGNEIYWKTRWEASADGSGTPYRTLVCYKEGTLGEIACGGKCDPLLDVWTGLWRDGCSFSPPADGCRPENALSGQISWVGSTGAIQVPGTFAPLRFWRDTAIATLLPNQTATLTGGTLGYEWNFEQFPAHYPPGRVVLSETIEGGRTHRLSLYRHTSGALVFGAGTVQWSWGLDGTHDRGASTPDIRMQQATVNLLAEMGAQPSSLQPGLVAATATDDVAAPASSIGFPLDGGSVQRLVPIVISGTAVESGGGVVAGVDVSTDGGATWSRAAGGASWTFGWTPQVLGATTIRVRAVDDLGNLETPGPSIAVTIEPAPPVVCPCSIWNLAAAGSEAGDVNAIEIGVRFRSDLDASVSGVRFFKHLAATGTHVGKLWTTTGMPLATATFTGETASGWQEVQFDSPVAITADTTYVASVFLPAGHYAFSGGYFASSGFDNPPLRALQDGEDGANGVYLYSATGGFPTQTFNSANYWVDIVIETDTGPDTTPPTVVGIAPGNGAVGVAVGASVSATFSEAMAAATIDGTTFELQDGMLAPVAATISYAAATRTATLDPAGLLAHSTTYTARVRGGGAAPRVEDVAGNGLAGDFTWTFTTGAPPPPPPDEGPGGPILVVAHSGNPFGRYHAEILRCEGLNAFSVTDITLVTPALLAAHDVVILAEMALDAAQVTMLGDWVTAGGNLIAMRPDPLLAGLLGLTPAGGTLGDAYLLVNTASGPGAGVVGQSIQFHGIADRYTASGASAVATLYSNATTATPHLAVTLRDVGGNGGQAACFTYDLARSIVYTRQGNPAWAGQERDGIGPLRSDDLFYGAAAGDPQPDWVDLDKVAIPQADEQQRLLANLILTMNGDRKPLPRFWYLPRGLKAAVVMTGDNHGSGGMASRYDTYLAQSPPGCSLGDWECVRASGYMYSGGPFTDAQALAYHNQGFEVGLHIDTGCGNWTAATLPVTYDTQLAGFAAGYPSVPLQSTNRTHCIVWSEWATQARVEAQRGIRLDTNYYYWPPTWVQNRPGMFTGSGMPMRFADLDGTMIDCYQAATQMTDESGQAYPFTIDALLDRALGPEGWYGAFCANMHFDSSPHSGSDAIVASALSRGVPVVSGRQMLEWLDGRNASSFGNLTWSVDTLDFTITVGSGANNLRAMLPVRVAVGDLVALTRDAMPVAWTVQVVKGVEYAFFPAAAGSWSATYQPDLAGPVITNIVATPAASGTSATITWTTDEPADSRVDYGTSPGMLDQSTTDGALVTAHAIVLAGLLPATTYDFRVTSADLAANATTSPAAPDPPATFTTPAAPVSPCAADDLTADFTAGSTGPDTWVSETTDGEVILRPAASAEFSGSALPADWGAFPWPGGGTATVAGGLLTVDGTRVNSLPAPGFPVGRALEFVATFQATPNQHIGFGAGSDLEPGAIFSTTPFILFSTGAGGTTLLARSVPGTDVTIPGSWLGTSHRYRIHWLPSSIDFYIDGSLVHSQPGAVAGPMRPAISDLAGGGATLVVDWIRMTDYAIAGSFDSRTHDAGAPTTWGALTWTAQTPSGTSVAMQARTGNTPMPDGSWTAFVPIPTSGSVVGGLGRYLQYRAALATTSSLTTPVVEDVAVACSATADTTPPVITNLAAAVGMSGTSATVTWDTDENATSRLDYGTSPALLDQTLSVPGFALAHAVPLSGLALGATYYYRATSADPSTNSATEPAPPNAPLAFTTPTPPAPPCALDDVYADFAAGTTGAETYLAADGDGEVTLRPATGAEFEGTSLDAGWGSFPWSGGGGATVGGGRVAVDGARINSLGAGFGPGRTLEFVATFRTVGGQHIGFGAGNDMAPGEIYNVVPFVLFSSDGTQLRALTNTGSEVATDLGAALLDVLHRYRIDWNAATIDFFVDGAPVASHAVAAPGPMRPAASDFFVAGPALDVEWIRLQPYPPAGSFLSRVHDAGSAAAWGAVTWTTTEPAGTTVAIAARAGNTPAPDGSWSSFVGIPSSGSSAGLAGRYLQYRADLATADPARTPVLLDVALACTATPDATPPVITNLTATVGPSGTSATITWDTDETATSRVDYGTSPALLDQTATVPGFASTHAVPLAGLALGTTYYYRATSADPSSNSTTEPAPPNAPLSFTTPPPPCFVDATTVDFAAGTIGAATAISETADGEVILAPTRGAEFGGTSLTAGWGAFPWGSGGTATVAGGVLTVDGSRVNSEPVPGYGPGRSLEFVATFAAAPFQHVGFGGGNDVAPGEIFNTSPWAMFSTGSGGTALQARVWAGGPFIDFTIPGSWLGASHRYRIDWTPGGFDFHIDGTLVHTEPTAIASAMRPAMSDFSTGGATLVVDWIRMSDYAAAGRFESRVFDAGVAAAWGAATWAIDAPAGTAVAIEVRTGPTPVPDGGWSAWVPVAVSGTTVGTTTRYIQYGADLTSSDAARTPALDDLSVSCLICTDTTPPVAVATLAATRVAASNDTDGTTKIAVTWPAVEAGAKLLLYRKGFGNYPEYDDAPNAGAEPPVPATPAAAVSAGWTLAATIIDGATSYADEPATRDFWYHVAFVEDACANVSAASNRTAGASNYHLGDVADGMTACAGDNRVRTNDVSSLGAHYGATLADSDSLACLDVGPTTDQTVDGRPTTDNQVQFEDLILFAVNHEQVAKARTTAAPMAADEVLLFVPETLAADGTLPVRIGWRGTGHVLGVSVRLAWDRTAVEPIGIEPGSWLQDQGGVALTPELGVVDVALLGSQSTGLAGEGLLATVRFRVLGATPAVVEVRAVDARDAGNRRVATTVRTGVDPATVAPSVTQLLAAVPNPFNPSTRIPFALAVEGQVELAIFAVDGRRVRTLVAGYRPAGSHEAIWSGTDERGARVSSGTYYVRLVAPDGQYTRPIVLVK